MMRAGRVTQPVCDLCHGAALRPMGDARIDGRRLSRCDDCGAVEATALDGRAARPTGGTAPRDPRYDRRRAEAVMRMVERGRILELGRADGAFLNSLDPARYDGVAAVAGAVRELPGESFTLVAMFGTLGRAASPRMLLMETTRLLAPGGLAVIETPCLSSLTARLCGTRWQPLADPEANWFFSAEALERLAAACGLTPVARRGAFLSAWPRRGEIVMVARKASVPVRHDPLSDLVAASTVPSPLGAAH